MVADTVNSCKWRLIKCTPVITGGLTKIRVQHLEKQCGEEMREEQRGQPTLSLQLIWQRPLLLSKHLHQVILQSLKRDRGGQNVIIWWKWRTCTCPFLSVKKKKNPLHLHVYQYPDFECCSCWADIWDVIHKKGRAASCIFNMGLLTLSRFLIWPDTTRAGASSAPPPPPACCSCCCNWVTSAVRGPVHFGFWQHSRLNAASFYRSAGSGFSGLNVDLCWCHLFIKTDAEPWGSYQRNQTFRFWAGSLPESQDKGQVTYFSGKLPDVWPWRPPAMFTIITSVIQRSKLVIKPHNKHTTHWADW